MASELPEVFGFPALESSTTAPSGGTKVTESRALRIVLGSTRLSEQAVQALTAGTVCLLDEAVDAPVRVYDGDQLIAYGELIVIDGVFGVRIVERANDAVAASVLRRAS